MNSRENMLRVNFITVLSALVSISLLINAKSINKDLFELTVIHINDFHARYEETSNISGVCKSSDECIGGFSRLYTELWSHQNRTNVIYLNAGDNFQGTLWYTIFGWNVTQHFLNMLPVDAYTLGNHEFDSKIAGVVPFIKALDKPVVVSNIDDSLEPSMQGLYNKSTIIYRGDKKIGIIGAIYANTAQLSQTENLKFLDEAESINKEAEKLVKENCDILIVVSHCGLDVDMRIAQKLHPKINLIVGGHSHTLLYNGKAPGVEQPAGPYPVVVERENGRKVLIVQASCYTKYVGNLTVFYDENGDVVNWNGLPIYLSHDKPQDEKINDEIKIWKEQVDNYGKRVLGQTNVFLDNDCHTHECNLGDFLADAMVDYYTKIAEPGSWTYSAVAFINSGGLRISIEKGNITYNDLATCTPFESTIDVGEVPGTAIKEALEYSVTETTLKKSYSFWQFTQVSGLRFTADLSRPTGSKILDLKVRCQNCTTPVFEDFNPNATYRIALLSFIVNGGDGYTMLRDNLKNLKRGDLDKDVYEDYIMKMSPINIQVDGRINIING